MTQFQEIREKIMKRKATTAGLGTLRLQSKRRRQQPYNARITSSLNRTSRTAEYKVTDYGVTGTVNSTGSVLTPLINLTRGNDYFNNFIGQRIMPVGFRFRYTWSMGPVAGVGDGTNVCRVIIFQWLDAGTPTIAQITQNSTVLSPTLLSNRDKINVLHDHVTTLAQYAGSALGYDCKAVDGYVKGRRMVPTEYTTGLVATVNKGNIFVMALTDSAIPPAPSLNLYTRLTFND